MLARAAARLSLSVSSLLSSLPHNPSIHTALRPAPTSVPLGSGGVSIPTDRRLDRQSQREAAGPRGRCWWRLGQRGGQSDPWFWVRGPSLLPVPRWARGKFVPRATALKTRRMSGFGEGSSVTFCRVPKGRLGLPEERSKSGDRRSPGL